MTRSVDRRAGPYGAVDALIESLSLCPPALVLGMIVSVMLVLLTSGSIATMTVGAFSLTEVGRTAWPDETHGCTMIVNTFQKRTLPPLLLSLCL